jgi:hypothetical protein
VIYLQVVQAQVVQAIYLVLVVVAEAIGVLGETHQVTLAVMVGTVAVAVGREAMEQQVALAATA